MVGVLIVSILAEVYVILEYPSNYFLLGGIAILIFAFSMLVFGDKKKQENQKTQQDDICKKLDEVIAIQKLLHAENERVTQELQGIMQVQKNLSGEMLEGNKKIAKVIVKKEMENTEKLIQSNASFVLNHAPIEVETPSLPEDYVRQEEMRQMILDIGSTIREENKQFVAQLSGNLDLSALNSLDEVLTRHIEMLQTSQHEMLMQGLSYEFGQLKEELNVYGQMLAQMQQMPEVMAGEPEIMQQMQEMPEVMAGEPEIMQQMQQMPEVMAGEPEVMQQMQQMPEVMAEEPEIMQQMQEMPEVMAEEPEIMPQVQETMDEMKEILQEMQEEVIEEIPEAMVEEVVEEIPEAIVEEVVEETTEEIKEETVEEIPEEVIEEIAEEAEEEVTQEIAEEAEEKVTQEITEEAEEEVTQEIAEELEQLEALEKEVENHSTSGSEMMTPEEIAKLLEEMNTEEPEEEKVEIHIDDDPNRQLSPEEIAALFSSI